MDEHGNGLRNFVIGALVGATVGAALGVLLAPRSGAETRKMVRDKAEDLLGDIRERADKLMHGEHKEKPA